MKHRATGILIKEGKILLMHRFELENQYYFLIENFSGEISLGGPEKEKMNQDNQYFLEWIDIATLEKIENLYPKEAIHKFKDLYI